MKQIKLNTILNHNFELEGCMMDDYLSVLTAGYIITPDGKCVIIPDGVDHADICSTYIYQFLETKYVFYQSTEAIEILTNHPFSDVNPIW